MITVKNKGFNRISSSADKELYVNGRQVASLFCGSVTTDATQQDQLNEIIALGIPVENYRVSWAWAVKQLVSDDKLRYYLTA